MQEFASSDTWARSKVLPVREAIPNPCMVYRSNIHTVCIAPDTARSSGVITGLRTRSIVILSYLASSPPRYSRLPIARFIEDQHLCSCYTAIGCLAGI